jgi:transposase
MFSHVQLKQMQKLLNLPGVKVIAYQAREAIGIIIHLQALQKEAICPRCQKTSEKLHQNHWYFIRDLAIAHQPVYLRVNRRQFKCDRCQKPFSEELDFVERRRSYTKRLATDIVAQVLESNIRSVAQQNDLTEELIEGMLRDTQTNIAK